MFLGLGIGDDRGAVALFSAVSLIGASEGFSAQYARSSRSSWASRSTDSFAGGWLLPIGRHLPGFSFFRGPGRYGIVATLTIALLAGHPREKHSFRG